MKIVRIASIILTLCLILTFVGCVEKIEQIVENDDNTAATATSYDAWGKNLNTLSEELRKYGKVMWVNDEQCYSFSFGGEALSKMRSTMELPNDAENAVWWKNFENYIIALSEDYSCKIRVSNPLDASKALFIVDAGNIKENNFNK